MAKRADEMCRFQPEIVISPPVIFMPVPSFFCCRPKFSISYLSSSPKDKRETESLVTFPQLLLSPMPTLCQRGGVTRSQSHYEDRKTNKHNTHTHARAHHRRLMLYSSVSWLSSPSLHKSQQACKGREEEDAYIKEKIKTKASHKQPPVSKTVKIRKDGEEFLKFLFNFFGKSQLTEHFHSPSMESHARPFQNRVHKMEVSRFSELGGCAHVHGRHTRGVIRTGTLFPWLLCVFIPHL